MGNLLSRRTAPSEPFEVTGIDYAGPIKVRALELRGNITQKGDIAIFVCFSIHMQCTLRSLTTIPVKSSSMLFIVSVLKVENASSKVENLHSDKALLLLGRTPF